MKTDGHNRILVPGMALPIQLETDHAIANESFNEVRLLVISAPSTRSDRHEIGVKK